MRALLIFMLIFTARHACSQQNVLYPESFVNWFNAVPLINPAFIPEIGKAEFTAAYKNRTGAFNKITSFTLIADKIFRKENKAAHLARLVIYNEKEGPYIDKPRALLNYAYAIPLSEESHLMAGASLGINQVSFSAPSATGSGSGRTPDGAVGLYYRSKHLAAGISSHQLFNSNVTPLVGSLQYKRYYNFLASGTKDISPDMQVKGYLLYQVFPSIKDNYGGNLLLSYKEVFSFGSGYSSKYGLAFIAGFSMPLGNDQLQIFISYQSPLAQNLSVANSLEFLGKYRIE